MKFLIPISVFSAIILCFLNKKSVSADVFPEETFISITGDNYVIKQAGQGSRASILVNTFGTTVRYPCSSGDKEGVCVDTGESCESQGGEYTGFCYISDHYEGVCCLGITPHKKTTTSPVIPVLDDASSQETRLTLAKASSSEKPVTNAPLLPTMPDTITAPVIPSTLPPMPPMPRDPSIPTGIPSVEPTIPMPTGFPSVITTTPTVPTALPSMETTIPSLPIGLPPINTQIPQAPAVPTIPTVPTSLPGIPGSLTTISAGIPTLPPNNALPGSLPTLPPNGLPGSLPTLPPVNIPSSLPPFQRKGDR